MNLFAIAADPVKLAFYGMQAVVVLAALAVLLHVPLRARWAWAVTAAGLATLAIWSCGIRDAGACDFKVFWRAGADVLAGRDPYENPGCVNPPTAFALYAPLALLPYHAAHILWVVLNVGGAAVLAAFAQSALAGAGDDASWRLPAPVLGVLTALVAMSVSVRYGMEVGQVALLTTLALLLAVHAWTRGRAPATGIALALASVKAATMLPFLLLLHRRKDGAAWVVLTAAGFGLFLLANPPGELLARLGACHANIAHLAQPGKMNDYAMGSINADLIGIDRALYFSGLTDRTVVRALQLGLTALLGAWVAWRVCGKRKLPPAAACCLVAFYAAMFLYHRLYDMVILALPLVYATGRARSETGAVRVLYTASVMAIIGLLYLRLETIHAVISALSSDHPPSPWLQALVIPHAFWLLSAAMAFFSAAEHVRSRRQAADPVAPLRTEMLRFPAAPPGRLTAVNAS